jgi:hypothetical protein
MADHSATHFRPNKTFRTATGHKPTNQRNHKANICRAIVQGHPNKTAGQPMKAIIRDSYVRKAEQHCSEQQIPSSQQPVHLMMAG